MKTTRTIAFRVSEPVHSDLLQLATINGLTVSEVVRTMIEAELAARAELFKDGPR